MQVTIDTLLLERFPPELAAIVAGYCRSAKICVVFSGALCGNEEELFRWIISEVDGIRSHGVVQQDDEEVEYLRWFFYGPPYKEKGGEQGDDNDPLARARKRAHEDCGRFLEERRRKVEDEERRMLEHTNNQDSQERKRGGELEVGAGLDHVYKLFKVKDSTPTEEDLRGTLCVFIVMRGRFVPQFPLSFERGLILSVNLPRESCKPFDSMSQNINKCKRVEVAPSCGDQDFGSTHTFRYRRIRGYTKRLPGLQLKLTGDQPGALGDLLRKEVRAFDRKKFGWKRFLPRLNMKEKKKEREREKDRKRLNERARARENERERKRVEKVVYGN